MAALGVVLGLALAASPARAEASLDEARKALDDWRLRDAAALLAAAKPAPGSVEPAVLEALLAYRRSDYAAVVKRLDPLVKAHGDAYEARVVLGEALLAQGQKDEAFAALDPMADDYNDDRITSARDLSLLGVGLRLTGYVKNANRVFQEALKKEPQNVEAKLAWADLLLSKYNYRDSDGLYRDVLKQRPGDVRASVGAARVAIASDAAYAEATELLSAVLARAPECVPAHSLMALIDIQNERPDAAIARLEQTSLKLAPRDSEALSLYAAAFYLLDDAKGYAAAEKRALAVNPKSVELYVTVAEHAERVHRYAEARALLEKALAFDPESGDALAGLGTAWSRLGDDAKAHETLKAAFDADPYNVKTFNLLEHFYETVDSQFAWVEAPPMRVRVDKKEKAVLERYVPKLLGDAWKHFSKKYGFTPALPMQIEIFPDPQTFAVRSVGLPSLAAHGICFGHVITARSPSAGDFNWGEVLWHEMAHVYHIQLSDSRVPRWFTEGFAVYESIEGRPNWQREMDPELRSALKAKKLRGFDDFNLSFTQAKSLDDILVAYYHAFEVARFMNTAFGFPKVKKMLELWGKRKPTDVVIKEALGIDTAELDRRFFAWLDKELSYLDAAYPFDVGAIVADKDAVLARAALPTADAHALAEGAVAKLGSGDPEGATALAEKALAADPNEALALWTRGSIRLGGVDKPGGIADLEALVKLGKAGVDVRTTLAHAAADAGDHAAAAAHLEAALTLDPKNIPLYDALASELDQAGKAEQAFAWRAKQADVDQMNAAVVVKLLTDAVAMKASKADILKWGEQAVFVAPFDLGAHVAFARAAKAVGAADVARYEAQTALVIAPDDADAKALLH
ncbi:MAG: tetratricopeptide repeat protein [Myxococcota bacterium]